MCLFCMALQYDTIKTVRSKIKIIDEDLLHRIAQGDMEALRCLYDIAGYAVFGFALSMLKNKQDAEDILQDTFLKIRSAAHLYQPRGTPMAWILTMTRNFCLMKLREKQKNQAIEEKMMENTMLYVQDNTNRVVLEAAFSILTDEERRIIMLHVLSGLKHREIAQILELPLSTVLSKNNRALKKLKQYLQKGD